MTNTSDIISFLEMNHIPYEKDVDIKTKTLIKRGGITRFWVQPENRDTFEKLIKFCQLNATEFEVVGSTSNSYFLNDYNPLMVISTIKVCNMQVKNDVIECDCGCNLVKVARYCNKHGIEGFEGFTRIPGTIAGAAINNSGCMESEMSKVVRNISIIKNGEIHVLNLEDIKYQYRNSSLKSKEIKGVVLSVTLNCSKNRKPSDLIKRSREIQSHRKLFIENNFANLGTTFSVLQFKKLPFVKRIINLIFYKFINLVCFNPAKKLKYRTRLHLYLRNAGSFKKYVSDYGIQCFIWKDSNADKAFNEYVDFIKKNTIRAVMEIDIKKAD